MDTKKHQLENLIDDARSYLEAREKLAKLQMTEKATHVAADLMSWFIIVPVFFIAFLFVSVSLAHVIGEWWGHEYAGYLSVTLLYVVIGFILVKFRKGILVKPIMDGLIKQVFSKEHYDNN